ncbi:hypothetical protein OAN96_00925 [Candidatus Gracilibacteria bacterium]|nr:hypothetical protein [Candidatus Gracilibacteria bacterium]
MILVKNIKLVMMEILSGKLSESKNKTRGFYRVRSVTAALALSVLSQSAMADEQRVNLSLGSTNIYASDTPQFTHYDHNLNTGVVDNILDLDDLDQSGEGEQKSIMFDDYEENISWEVGTKTPINIVDQCDSGYDYMPDLQGRKDFHKVSSSRMGKAFLCKTGIKGLVKDKIKSFKQRNDTGEDVIKEPKKKTLLGEFLRKGKIKRKF